MKRDIGAFFARQAAWQAGRAGLSWGDKLRKSVILRNTVIALRKGFERREKSAVAENQTDYGDKS